MNMEERLSRLEAKVQRLEDIEEIHNLMYRYFFYFANHSDRIENELFSQTNPNVYAIIGDRGKYTGIDKIKEIFGAMRETYLKVPGFMGFIIGMNPVIEVAKDGKTAQGLWYGFGPHVMPGLDTNELTQKWLFGKYVMEYVKEDDGWKILGLTFLCIFRTSYEKGWLKEQETKRVKFAAKPSQTSDEVNTHHPYDPTIVNPFLPNPPERIR